MLGCEKGSEQPKAISNLPEIPAGFDRITYPEDNKFDELRWKMGKALFFDTRLSIDGSISCASCHRPEFAFADNRATSPGANRAPGTLNVPSLTNVAYHPYLTNAGGVPTLEMQILVPIQESNEFNHNVVDIVQQLKYDSTYNAWSQDAFGDSLSVYAVTRALANYERTLISGNSPYDQYAYQGDLEALSKSAIRGMELFNSDRLNCASCHSGFNFTNYTFRNNGLYKEYAETGKHKLTREPRDRATFKVPSLRNVAITAPYMHDGSIESLDGVIDHYENGVFPHPNLGPEIHDFQLSDRERKDLINFLESLTDANFIANQPFRTE